jgi:hypothetical protein
MKLLIPIGVTLGQETVFVGERLGALVFHSRRVRVLYRKLSRTLLPQVTAFLSLNSLPTLPKLAYAAPTLDLI